MWANICSLLGNDLGMILIYTLLDRYEYSEAILIFYLMRLIQYSTAQGGFVDDLRKKAVSDEYHMFCS